MKIITELKTLDFLDFLILNSNSKKQSNLFLARYLYFDYFYFMLSQLLLLFFTFDFWKKMVNNQQL